MQLLEKKEVVLNFLLGQMVGNWQICFQLFGGPF